MDIMRRGDAVLYLLKKCASTSLAAALDGDRVDDKRIPYRHRSAAFVRNPWDRVVSVYRDLVDREDALFYAPLKRFGMSPRMEFPEFIEAVFSHDDTVIDHHLRSCTAEIAGRRIDYLGRLETLRSDWGRIAPLLVPGIRSTRIGYSRRSPRPRASCKYWETAGLYDAVADRYEEDIRAFYSWEGGLIPLAAGGSSWR